MLVVAGFEMGVDVDTMAVWAVVLAVAAHAVSLAVMVLRRGGEGRAASVNKFAAPLMPVSRAQAGEYRTTGQRMREPTTLHATMPVDMPNLGRGFRNARRELKTMSSPNPIRLWVQEKLTKVLTMGFTVERPNRISKRPEGQAEYRLLGVSPEAPSKEVEAQLKKLKSGTSDPKLKISYDVAYDKIISIRFREMAAAAEEGREVSFESDSIKRKKAKLNARQDMLKDEKDFQRSTKVNEWLEKLSVFPYFQIQERKEIMRAARWTLLPPLFGWLIDGIGSPLYMFVAFNALNHVYHRGYARVSREERRQYMKDNPYVSAMALSMKEVRPLAAGKVVVTGLLNLWLCMQLSAVLRPLFGFSPMNWQDPTVLWDEFNNTVACIGLFIMDSCCTSKKPTAKQLAQAMMPKKKKKKKKKKKGGDVA